MVYYILNIFQIIGLLSPSYIYFFQTIFGIKSKEVEYVYEFLNDFKVDLFSDEDESSYFKNKIVFNNIIEELNEESNEIESREKTIDDSSISELKNNTDSSLNKCKEMFQMVKELIIADNYLPLFYFSTAIALDRHKQFRKRICMIIFLILNIICISYDIYQLIKDYSDYFLASVIIRFILIPLFSYYNIFTVLYHKAKNKTLRIVNYVSIIFTCIIVVVIIFVFIYSGIYQTKYRLNNLEYVPPTNDIINVNENISHPVCDFRIFNDSVFDSFGYALGGYDIKHNITIFENQLKIFFGENYSSHISYKLYEIDKYFLFLKYFDSYSKSHIFAFRGYDSITEIAFQFELFVSHYIIPLFEDNVPFYEFINDNWLSFYTNFLNSFGLQFFENRNLIVKYVNSIIDIYNKEDLTEDKKVYFTGINCGGVIAKIVGTLLHHKSISFFSFPVEMDFLEHLFDFKSTYMSYITNVYNIDGFFSHPDSNHAINIGIDTPIFYKSKFCTSDFCDIFSKIDNIYRTFCTMSEICGKGNQFNYYCINTIGKKNLEIIRESLEEND